MSPGMKTRRCPQCGVVRILALFRGRVQPDPSGRRECYVIVHVCVECVDAPAVRWAAAS